MTERQRHDVPVIPGRPDVKIHTIMPPAVNMNMGQSTLWRATRLILAWVAIVAIVEIVIIMTLTLAAGVSVLSRLADPTPTISECVGEVCGD